MRTSYLNFGEARSARSTEACERTRVHPNRIKIKASTAPYDGSLRPSAVDSSRLHKRGPVLAGGGCRVSGFTMDPGRFGAVAGLGFNVEMRLGWRREIPSVFGIPNPCHAQRVSLGSAV